MAAFNWITRYHGLGCVPGEWRILFSMWDTMWRWPGVTASCTEERRPLHGYSLFIPMILEAE